MKYLLKMILLLQFFIGTNPTISNAQTDELLAFKTTLSTAVNKHLSMLLNSDGTLRPLNGKATDASTAIAFYRMYELYGNKKYREVALTLADEILAAMKQTKFGVLYIKEKEDGDGKKIAGGGPPALGFYAANLAYIYSKELNRNADIVYIATVLDNFPYNEKGWWANTIDIQTGEPKNGLQKPTPINKNAAMAMAAGIVSGLVKNINPALAERLLQKTNKCLYQQILPAQEQDGFWHYGLNGNDPKDKDVLGYFMVTTDALLQLYHGNEVFKTGILKASLIKATGFANNTIAPITEPNKNVLVNKFTLGTPTQYKVSGEIKRGYAIGSILLAGGYSNEAIKIIKTWSFKFPYGNTGSDGGHALISTIAMLNTIEKGGIK